MSIAIYYRQIKYALKEYNCQITEKIPHTVSETPTSEEVANFLTFLFKEREIKDTKLGHIHTRSLLNWLSSFDKGACILREWLRNVQLKSAFLAHPEFIPALLTSASEGSEKNLSALYWLFVFCLAHEVFNDLSTNEEFANRLYSNPQFFDAFLAIASDDEQCQLYAFYWCTYSLESIALLSNMLENTQFINNLVDHPQFISVFFSSLAGEDSNLNCPFYELIQTLQGSCVVAKLFTSNNFKKAFFAYPKLLDELFMKRTESDPQSTIFYWLTEYESHTGILDLLLKNKTFKKKLLKYPGFIQHYCNMNISPDGEYSTSPLIMLLQEEATVDIFLKLVKDIPFTNKLLHSYEFMLTLVTPDEEGTTGLFWFARSTQVSRVFLKFLDNVDFRERLLRNASLVPTLLYAVSARENEGSSCFFECSYTYIGTEILLNLLNDREFRTTLLAHPNFISTLFKNLTINDVNYLSPFSQLALRNNGLSILQIFILDPNFLTFFEKPENVEYLCNALLDGKPSTLEILLRTPVGTRIIQTLLNNPAIKMALFERLNIVGEGNSMDWIFQSEAGFAVFKALMFNDRLNLLRHCSPYQLYYLPQVQQLLHMRQIDRNVFLFLSINSPNEEDFYSLMRQYPFSPWATTEKGYSLSDVINALPIDEESKLRRLEFLQSYILDYAKNASSNNFVVHFHGLQGINHRPDEESLAPSLPPALEASYNILELDSRCIQQFHQYIQWILQQPTLSAYFPIFNALASNEIIRNNAQDYLTVLENLKSLCTLINGYVHHQRPIPEPYSEWVDSFRLCFKGVITAFGEMFNEFSNQAELNKYFSTRQNEAMTYYCRLFSTPKNVETHVPVDAIHAEMGLSSTPPSL